MSELFALGGYGAYVWPSFLLAAIVLVWNVVAARRLHARARREAQRRFQNPRGPA